MKTFLRLISVSISLVGLCSTAAGDVAQSEDSPQPINNPVAGWDSLEWVAHVFPPFQYKKDGVIVGPFIEIMRLACIEASINCKVHMHSWKNSYQDLISGEVDGMFSFLMSDDPARSALVKYGPPIVDTYYSFFVSSTSNWKWTGKITDLDDRTVGVYGLGSGTYIVARDLVSQNKTARLVVEDTNLKVFQQLVIGKYGVKSAVVANKDVGLHLLQSANIFGPQVAGDIQKEKFSFAFSRNSKRQDLYVKMVTATQVLKDRGIIPSILTNFGLVPSK